MTASLIFFGIAPAATAPARQESALIPHAAPIQKKRIPLTLIRPPPIILPPNFIRLPAPKEPAILLLIRLDLRREPPPIPLDMIVRRREIGIVPFEVIRDAEAELADDGGPIAAAVVVAGEMKVGGRGAGVVDAVIVGPFDVAVIVVGGEVVVGEVLVRVAGAPFRVLRFQSCQSNAMDGD